MCFQLIVRRCYQLCRWPGRIRPPDSHKMRISTSACLGRKNFRSPIKYTKFQSAVDIMKKRIQDDIDEEPNSTVDSTTNEDLDNGLDNLIERSMYIPGTGYQVLVIQPYIKYGPDKKKLTTPQLQLNEATTLVKTLRNWKVVDEMVIPLTSLNRSHLFGSGQLDNLRKKVLENKKITAVFISVNMLRPVQQLAIQDILGVPVFDRYSVVIHIFREHATTKEAKLQIKLAELPYLWSRLKSIKQGTLANFGGGALAIGSMWRGKEFHQQLLRQREAKIKNEILKLRQHRKLIRKNRIVNEIPIVAVVGYTNSGKTSLIKCLTGKENLEPQDYLFATLDVSVHVGYLPSSMTVLYVDTIGFMSDLPNLLFESFVSTLEEVKIADVIVHVRDISHPDNAAQNQNVLETLKALEMPEELSDSVITVGNKIDLVSEKDKGLLDKHREEGLILVSATEMTGTDLLRQRIEEKVVERTGRQTIVVKVRTGGDEYFWLLENAVIIDETPFPEDNQYTLMKVIITQVAFAKFKHNFIKNYRSR